MSNYADQVLKALAASEPEQSEAENALGIKVGDEVINPAGDHALVESIECGKFGILLKGHFILDPSVIWEAFALPEMPPPDAPVYSWHGWAELAADTVARTGRRFAIVSLSRGEPSDLAYYERRAAAMLEQAFKAVEVSHA